MGSFVPNFASGSLPMSGGMNQYMRYPTMGGQGSGTPTAPVDTTGGSGGSGSLFPPPGVATPYQAAPGSGGNQYQTPPFAAGPPGSFNGTNPGNLSGAGGPGTVPGYGAYSGYPGFGSNTGAPYVNNIGGQKGAVGAGNELQYGAATDMASDPLYTQGYDSWLRTQLGSGISPYGLQGYLPSSNTYTSAGQVAAPLTSQLQQLQQTLQTGQGGSPATQQYQNLAQTGGVQQGVLGNLLNTGGQTGYLGDIGSSGGISGILQQLYQNGGLTGNLGANAQTGGLVGPLSDLASTGGLNTGNLAELASTGGLNTAYLQNLLTAGGTPGALGGVANTPGGLAPGTTLAGLAQTGGLTGNMANLASTGNPIDQTPAWQAMVASENQNTQIGEANLKEQFASMGDLSSSSAADAMSQYLQQTTLGQNAQLTQAQTQAMQQAVQNQLAAGTTGINTQLGAGTTGLGAQVGAGEFGAGLQSQLGQFGVNTEAQVGQNANQQMAQVGQFGVNTQDTLGQFGVGTQQQIGETGISNQLASLLPSLTAQQNVGLAGLSQEGSASSGLTGLESSVGQFEQGLDQASIQNLMNEYFQTTPQENPLNQEEFGFATTYPPMYTKQGNVGSGLVGSLGGILSGAGDLGSAISDAGGLAAMFGL